MTRKLASLWDAGAHPPEFRRWVRAALDFGYRLGVGHPHGPSPPSASTGGGGRDRRSKRTAFA